MRPYEITSQCAYTLRKDGQKPVHIMGDRRSELLVLGNNGSCLGVFLRRDALRKLPSLVRQGPL